MYIFIFFSSNLDNAILHPSLHHPLERDLVRHILRHFQSAIRLLSSSLSDLVDLVDLIN